MSANEVSFRFRVWLYPEAMDDRMVEVWYDGLEPTDQTGRLFTDWISETFSENDFFSDFDLDVSKHWQVVGAASIRAWYDHNGEYDEEISIEGFESAEFDPTFFDDELIGFTDESASTGV